LKSATPPALDPGALPPWVRWRAQDADGVWWGYAHEPNLSDASGYENEVGRYIRPAQTEPDPAWRSTPTRRQA
jgi:hypothetical protein